VEEKRQEIPGHGRIFSRLAAITMKKKSVAKLCGVHERVCRGKGKTARKGGKEYVVTCLFEGLARYCGVFSTEEEAQQEYRRLTRIFERYNMTESWAGPLKNRSEPLAEESDESNGDGDNQEEQDDVDDDEDEGGEEGGGGGEQQQEEEEDDEAEDKDKDDDDVEDEDNDEQQTSEYRGVTRNKRDGKWVVKIGYDSKTHHIGHFDNELEAAQAYDEAANRHHGGKARLNFLVSEVQSVEKDGEADAEDSKKKGGGTKRSKRKKRNSMGKSPGGIAVGTHKMRDAGTYPSGPRKRGNCGYSGCKNSDRSRGLPTVMMVVCTICVNRKRMPQLYCDEKCWRTDHAGQAGGSGGSRDTPAEAKGTAKVTDGISVNKQKKKQGKDGGTKRKVAATQDKKCPHKDEHNSQCSTCGLGGELLCCDGCTLVYHTDCLETKPPKNDDNWFCLACVDVANEGGGGALKKRGKHGVSCKQKNENGEAGKIAAKVKKWAEKEKIREEGGAGIDLSKMSARQAESYLIKMSAQDVR
jgi:hypothetical protein